MLNSQKLIILVPTLLTLLFSAETDKYNKIFINESINQNGVEVSSNGDNGGVSAGFSFNISLSAEVSLYIPLLESIPNPVAYVVLTVGFGSGGAEDGGIASKITKRLKHVLKGDAKFIEFDLGALLSKVPIFDQLKDYRASIIFQIVEADSTDFSTASGKFNLKVNTSLMFKKKLVVLGISSWVNVMFKLPQMAAIATASKEEDLPLDFVEDSLDPEDVDKKIDGNNGDGGSSGDSGKGKEKQGSGVVKYVIFAVVCAVVVVAVVVVLTPKNKALNVNEKSEGKDEKVKGFSKPNEKENENGKLKE